MSEATAATDVSTPAAGGPAARAVGLSKVYGEGETQVVALRSVDVEFEVGPVHRDHGPVRLGQVHAHALHGRPGLAPPRARSSSASPT